MTTSSEILTTSLEMINEQFPNIWAVYLFGSFGTEYERADSDLDLAILLKETADPCRFMGSGTKNRPEN